MNEDQKWPGIDGDVQIQISQTTFSIDDDGQEEGENQSLTITPTPTPIPTSLKNYFDQTTPNTRTEAMDLTTPPKHLQMTEMRKEHSFETE